VFHPDGLRDELRDFELGIDRLDLTALGRIYSRDAIEFIAMTGGIMLRVAGEDIALYAADGKAISPSQLTDVDLFGPGHIQPIVQPDAPRTAYGTNLSEMFIGRGGNDTLLGGAGNDLLDGAGGNDWLLGGWDNDQLFGRDGDDTLWCGSGNDTGFGGQGADVLYGELGDDALWGREGNDLVWGNAGNDLLAGEADSDTLWGGNGNDTLWGDGWDVLRGEWGMISFAAMRAMTCCREAKAMIGCWAMMVLTGWRVIWAMI
jgi:Ca2+-binding RTX toxin-like protein